MNTAIEFPPGVAHARPFADAAEAVAWIASRDPDDYITTILGVDAWTDQALTLPYMPPHLMPLLPESDTLTAAFGYGENVAVTGLAACYAYMVGTDPDTSVVEGVPLIDPATITRPDVAMILWRTVRGLEIMARASIPGAKNRSKAAAFTEQCENYRAAVGDAVVRCVNAWLTTAWADAVNAGMPVYPSPDGTNPVAPASGTAVGVLRVGA